ncbi:VOC family protein [Marinicellulosiphila megalodicopiae]|uniref:VOC family protein n=1 Tax=Marinicellulosiphila megalodicopiae TaxID=2724896 RepID=UPI003BB19DE0
MTNTSVAMCLWFDGQAEQAAEFYTSLLPNSKILNVLRPVEGMPAVMVSFTLDGVSFQALNGGAQFKHSEAASICVTTQNQEQTDSLWANLIKDGGSEGQCAWLKDRFGVSWQIVPSVLPVLLGSNNKEASARVMNKMMTMKKIDIAALEKAFNAK